MTIVLRRSRRSTRLGRRSVQEKDGSFWTSFEPSPEGEDDDNEENKSKNTGISNVRIDGHARRCMVVINWPPRPRRWYST
jgi:hypothetical protein